MTTSFNLSSIEPNFAAQASTLQIRTATIADQKYITASLVLAFSTDPANRWLYSDPYHYLTYFPQFVAAFGGKAFEHNTVYCSDNYAGAALWFPPGVEPELQPVIDLIQQSVPTENQADLFAVFEQMDRYHPKYSHWYLSFLGVELSQQRQGYGSALIQPILQQCDRDRVPAYLESTNPANLPFYQRHGFEVLGTIQAGAMPPIFPMLRNPQ